MLLPCEPAAVQRARRFVSRALETWNMHQLTADAQLIVSELLTNTIDHTPCPTAAVTVQRPLTHRTRLTVTDVGVGIGVPTLSPADDTSERGRGLVLVEALSTRWGCNLQEDLPAHAGRLPRGRCDHRSAGWREHQRLRLHLPADHPGLR
ncbi:ATP-binding protein, partial [Streptomyces adustus]|uniref:ATP-binding protein n=1 Tax=Streptomyces adustus TaxID=1609272 RepID=UPI003B75C958